ncbi:hypothetical protein Taro_024619, partial [Colocasia esculenta]|nr:hypothetical protein [Colocasia esculenta]
LLEGLEGENTALVEVDAVLVEGDAVCKGDREMPCYSRAAPRAPVRHLLEATTPRSPVRGRPSGAVLLEDDAMLTFEMDRLPGIFNYKDEAYVIHLHRGMTLDDIVSDVCKRWTLSAEKVELKCIIPEQYNSKMTMTSGEDVDKMIDMHAMLNSRIMNVEVHVSSPQDVLTIRPSSALSSGSASNVLALEVNSSQNGSKRSELCMVVVNSSCGVII